LDKAKVVDFPRKPLTGADLLRELQVEGDINAPEIDLGPRKKLKRATGLFASSPEAWIVTPSCPLPTLWRLYYLLQIRSVQGTKPVHATNELALQIGITIRSVKMRHLRNLKTLGLVTVAHDGLKEPYVTLRPIPGWPPQEGKL
jgi:hypothetical protein